MSLFLGFDKLPYLQLLQLAARSFNDPPADFASQQTIKRPAQSSERPLHSLAQHGPSSLKTAREIALIHFSLFFHFFT
jgi:hypothetical protein